MLFNDFRFLFVFLPVVLALFFVPGAHRLRGVMLLLASLGFYASSGVEHAAVLCACIVWVFAVTWSPRFVGNRALLALAVAGPAAALFHYKYLGFFVRDVLGLSAGASPALFSLFGSIVLPAGISFFTFELVSYAVDRYRGQIPERPGFVRFALFVSFFPHLIAGPILRYRDVAASLAALPVFRLARQDASAGIAYITLGLASKVLVAEFAAPRDRAPGRQAWRARLGRQPLRAVRLQLPDLFRFLRLFAGRHRPGAPVRLPLPGEFRPAL